MKSYKSSISLESISWRQNNDYTSLKYIIFIFKPYRRAQAYSRAQRQKGLCAENQNLDLSALSSQRRTKNETNL